MSKIARIFLGLLCLSATVIMLVGNIAGLTSEMINPVLTNSWFDKLMFTFLFLGCAGTFAVWGIQLIKNLSIRKVQYQFLGFAYMFIFGMLYMLFDSPL